MEVSTKKVWTIGIDTVEQRGPYDYVNDRPVSVVIDPGHTIAHQGDVHGIIPVISGLNARDIAVSLTFTGKAEDEQETTDVVQGYIVSSADADGSGLLVHRDSLQDMPEQFMSPELFDRLVYIDSLDIGFFEGFSLAGLGEYIKHKRAAGTK